MTDAQTRQQLEAAVRGIATAGKTLKLYPPTSPIPRQAVENAAVAIDAYLDINSILSLSVARDGFAWRDEPLGTGVPGVGDLADTLRELGVAELDIVPGCDADSLMSFLSIVTGPAEDLQAQGGIGAALAAAGIESVRTTAVKLTVVEEVVARPDEDVDEFLRQLTTDPDRLATWLAAASAGDQAVFAEGLEELISVAGAQGSSQLAETLASAFMQQDPGGRDAVLGLSLEPSAVQSLAENMFGHLSGTDIASSICDGLYGQNMLSVSNMLTHLPLQQRMDQVYEEVQRMFAQGDRSGKELTFLEHMMEKRTAAEPEKPLVQTDTTYQQVAKVATLAPEEIDHMRRETEQSSQTVHASGVTTVLTLLDQQEDFELYCRSVDSLAAMVPHLIESGELALAHKVISELNSRESRAIQPWPDLSSHLRAAVARSVDARSMHALMQAVISNPETVAEARRIMHLAGDAGGPALITEAIALKDAGVRAAEDILGRRVLDLMVGALPQTQWFQLAPVVRRLAKEGDPRSMQAIDALVRRPDEQSRRETAQVLASVGGPEPVRLLDKLLHDESPEVAIVTIKSLAKNKVVGSADMFAKRLDELDIDNKDFAIAREIIGALARLDEPEATQALKSLVGRKALIKRGRFAEIHELARQALDVRAKQGGAR